MKKTQGKTKGTAKQPAKKRTATKAKKPADIVQVRENINDLVRDSAEDIATEVIKVAKTGQLASAKYLFEAVGLYPAPEAAAAKPEDNSLAQSLMIRLNALPGPAAEAEEDAEDTPEGKPVTVEDTVQQSAAPADCAADGKPGESAE